MTKLLNLDGITPLLTPLEKEEFLLRNNRVEYNMSNDNGFVEKLLLS